MMRILKILILASVALCASHLAWAQEKCPYRGELDAQYCDADKDLVADPPTDPSKFKTPDPLTFSYAPEKNNKDYEAIFKPFMDYLAQCTGKHVVFLQAKSNAAQTDAMRSGRSQLGSFSTGTTVFAVNIAGAVPFAVRGTAKGTQGVGSLVIVRSDSSFQKLTDLKGKRVAHTSPTSSTGHMAPMTLLPREGLSPGKDYEILFSGKHDQSILGVDSGEYDAAVVADEVLNRMIGTGTINEKRFRVLYRGPLFPTESFVYAHDLEPKLRDRLVKCFFDFRYPKEMQKEFENADRFIPISYQKDWAVVRDIAQASGSNRDAVKKPK